VTTVRVSSKLWPFRVFSTRPSSARGSRRRLGRQIPRPGAWSPRSKRLSPAVQHFLLLDRDALVPLGPSSLAPGAKRAFNLNDDYIGWRLKPISEGDYSMALPPILRDRLRLPVIASPLFIISNPDLVIAQCKAGIVGSFPSLNARPISQLDEWLSRITEELAAYDRAHPEAPSRRSRSTRSSTRPTTGSRKTSPCASSTRSRGHHLAGRARGLNGDPPMAGSRLHDVINDPPCPQGHREGRRWLDPVCGGRGRPCRHLVAVRAGQEIRQWFDGPVACRARSPGALDPGHPGHGRGPRLYRLGLHRDRRSQRHRGLQAGIVEGRADGIVYSNLFTGVHGNYLRSSIVNAGLDPENLRSAIRPR
jgi:nitronate monooxygenase